VFRNLCHISAASDDIWGAELMCLSEGNQSSHWWF